MIHLNVKQLVTQLRRTLVPSLSIGLAVCLVLGAMEAFGGFFEKIALFSAATAMPQGSVPVAVSVMRGEDSASHSVVSHAPQAQGTQSSGSDSESTESESPQSASGFAPQAEATVSQTVSSGAIDPVPVVPDSIPQNAGRISEYAFKVSAASPKIISWGGAFFSNTSKVSNDEILKILKQAPNLSLESGKPQVLIYHTHSSESYEMEDRGYYENGSSARTTDERYNMIRVGDEITAQLEAAGIGVIHDRALYDYPSYSGAYYRSADTVREYLKKYPSIQITLDIHRDAIEQKGGVRVKPTAVIAGKKAAQLMIIAGVDDGTMDFPDWRENMKFASALQQQMENSFPGLTRAAMVCHRRYNMYLTKNSLLIEVGGHANTLSEAVYSGEMIGKSLVEVIKKYQK